MEKIRKQIGKIIKEDSLKRLYELNEFLKALKLAPKYEPNIKPIRRTVGRAHKSGS